MSISGCSRNSIDDMGHIAILGSGMAGFGASHQLRAEGLDTVVYEKFAHLGGQTYPARVKRVHVRWGSTRVVMAFGYRGRWRMGRNFMGSV